jgi:hypothetical protein
MNCLNKLSAYMESGTESDKVKVKLSLSLIN